MFNYRSVITSKHKICSYEVLYKETSLYIKSPKNFKNKILKYLIFLRTPLENFIQQHPEFLTSLAPIKLQNHVPQIVKTMCNVSQKVGLGPMSAVAGTIAEFLGYEMIKWLDKENLRKFLIIENGGDIFSYVDEPITVGIYAGEKSIFTNRLGIKINLLNQPLGICSSSGTVGHSLSFGKADIVVIVSLKASFSDSLATATCNLVKTSKDVNKAIEFAKKFDETIFVCIGINRTISFWSKTDKIEIVKL